jgi:stress response protein SCP2
LTGTEGNLLVFLLNTKDHRLNFFANAKHFTRLGNALGPGKLGDVHQTFHAGFNFNKGTIRYQIDNLTGNGRTDGILLFDTLPGVILKLLESKRNALTLAVDFNDHHFDFLTLLEHFARVLDATPGHIGDVKETVETVEIHEGTVIGDVFDLTTALVARLDFLQKRAAFLDALLLDQFAAGNHNIFAVEVDLNNLEVVGLTYVLVEILGRLNIDLRSRAGRNPPRCSRSSHPLPWNEHGRE